MADSYRFVVADVFTSTPLAGNQLAVFTDARGLDDGTMQALALEIGFSETVFVLPAAADGTARIRIFNPRHEMPFAGHPTLGAAFVLAAPLQLGVVRLETGVGTVPVVLERDESGRIVFGRMTQPVPRIEPVERPERVLAAVGAAALAAACRALRQRRATHRPPRRGARAGRAAPRPGGDRRVRGHGRQLLRRRRPTHGESRMFWEHGEDPATGSAAGPIACHLARHGLIPWGDEIVIAQGVEMGRPSTLHARAEGGEGAITAVEVGGSAVVVARGEFRV